MLKRIFNFFKKDVSVSNTEQWSDTEYYWADDLSSCIARRYCNSDLVNKIEECQAKVIHEVIKEPTCTENGITLYSAVFEQEWAEPQSQKCQDIKLKEHIWEQTYYEWNDDCSICTAKRRCENCGIVEYENAEGVIVGVQPATCVQKGKTKYEAFFKNDWANNQRKMVDDLALIEPEWLEPIYNWSENNEECVAILKCKNDSELLDKMEYGVVEKVTMLNGLTKYTATFNCDWAKSQERECSNIVSPTTWNSLEEALLVEAYVAVFIEERPHDKIVKELSDRLRFYGQKIYGVIDDKYRNTNGINMKLRNIQYLFTDGESGLSSVSIMDKDIYNLYKQDQVKFRELLNEANQVYPNLNINKNINYKTCCSKILDNCVVDKLNSVGITTIGDFLVNRHYASEKYMKIEKYLRGRVDKPLNSFHELVENRELFHLLELDPQGYKHIPIEKLMLSTRAYNCLSREMKIFNIGDVMNLTRHTLSSVHGMGIKALNDIEAALIRYTNISELNDEETIEELDDVYLEIVETGEIKDVNFFNDISNYYRDDVLIQRLRNENINNVYDVLLIYDHPYERVSSAKLDIFIDIIKNFRKVASDIPVYKLLGVKLEDFECNDLSNYKFSVRVQKALLEELKANTLADLIKCTITEIKSLRGMGAKAFSEVEFFILQSCVTNGNEIKCIEKKIKEDEDLSNRCAKPFMELFSSNEVEIEKLKEIFTDDNNTLEDGISKANNNPLLVRFYKWCTMNVYEEVGAFIASIENSKSMVFEIIEKRADGMTLNEVGAQFNLTRERIRQLEYRCITQFGKWNEQKRILNLICALREYDRILTHRELEEYFDDYTDIVIYLLRHNDSDNYKYDKDLEVFIIGDDSLSDKTENFLEALPESFSVSDLSRIIEKAEEKGIDEEYLLKAIDNAFCKTEKIYHRQRLSLARMYEMVLGRYFPDGLHVYDDESMEDFKIKMVEMFGNVSMPDNNRAIAARICDNAVLCGRGIYKPKQKLYISVELKNKISEYIRENENEIYPINSLFSVFEKELKSEGIDNKYYMQGVLKELIGNEFVFKRDYIAKNEKSSFYSEVKEFIKSNDYPVTKEEIREHFSGITDIMLNLSVNNDEIINFFGKYLHGSKLNLTHSNIMYIKGKLSEILSESTTCHCQELFENIQNDRKDILDKAGIFFQYSLFSVVHYLFDAEYEFSRPYISKKGCKIEKMDIQVSEFLEDYDKIKVETLLDFTKEKKFSINNILDFINSQNETHLLINKDELYSIDDIGINEEYVKEMEEILEEEVTETCAIGSLLSVRNFKKLNVPWDKWLVYSILNKWGTKFDVAASSNQFRNSVPLIAPKGLMEIDEDEDYENAEVEYKDDEFDIDNLFMSGELSLEDFDIDLGEL